jgi:hypothetical protein
MSTLIYSILLGGKNHNQLSCEDLPQPMTNPADFPGVKVATFAGDFRNLVNPLKEVDRTGGVLK